MSATITIKRNGSIRVEGDFVLLDADGNAYDLNGRSRISLCRCGRSGDMPFCDSTHKTVGFVDESRAHVLPPLQK